MRKLLLLLLVFISVNVFGQKKFKCIEFKVVEKDAVTSVPCHLLVKNKNDSILIENIVEQKNIVVPINSSTFFYFIKGDKIIYLYPSYYISEYGNSVAFNCEVVFNADDSCTIISTPNITSTTEWGSSLNRDENLCKIIYLKPEFIKSKKVKFKKIKLKS